MNAHPEGISETLTALDAVEASWAHAAARRLAAIGIRTRIHADHGESSAWYLGDNFAFRPTPQRSAPVGAPADALVRALNDHDDLLAEIEAATGYATEFSDYGTLSSDAPVLCLMRAGEQLGELVVRASLEDPSPPKPTGFIALEVVAARLGLPDAEALGKGDLVILSHGPWPLAIAPECCGATELAFDPIGGRLAPAFLHPEQPQDTPPMTDAATKEMLRVPVTLRLADLALSTEEIASLTSSGTIDIGPVAEGLNVTVSVGGRTIGRGEIVRLGDRFGILLDNAAGCEAQEAPEGMAEDTLEPSVDETGDGVAPTPSEAA